MSIDLFLLIAAAICFGLAAANVAIGSLNLVALGLLFWVLTALIP